jgi:hypothetical protein
MFKKTRIHFEFLFVVWLENLSVYFGFLLSSDPRAMGSTGIHWIMTHLSNVNWLQIRVYFSIVHVITLTHMTLLMSYHCFSYNFKENFEINKWSPEIIFSYFFKFFRLFVFCLPLLFLDFFVNVCRKKVCRNFDRLFWI